MLNRIMCCSQSWSDIVRTGAVLGTWECGGEQRQGCAWQLKLAASNFGFGVKKEPLPGEQLSNPTSILAGAHLESNDINIETISIVSTFTTGHF